MAIAQGDRLSGAGEGGCRRRRPRHEGRANRRRPDDGAVDRVATRPSRRSATPRSIWKNICRSRVTSKSRCSATAAAAPSISASATARCSGATRRSGRKAPRPRSAAAARAKIGETCRQGDAGHEVSRRRHRRIPVRGRRVLFHRNEHPHPGRASGHRDDHRHRSRAGADPHRRRRRPAGDAGRDRHHRPRHRMPRQRGKPA